MNNKKDTESFEKSKWVQRMKEILSDPQRLAEFEQAVAKFLEAKGKSSPAMARAHQAYRMFRTGKAKDLLTPRNAILLGAALLYLISPMDAIPDFAPVIGLLDDLGILSLILALVIPAFLKNDGVPSETGEELRREARVIENELNEAQQIDAEIIDDAEIPQTEAEKDTSLTATAKRLAAYFRQKK